MFRRMPDQGRQVPLIEALVLAVIILILAFVVIGMHFHLF